MWEIVLWQADMYEVILACFKARLQNITRLASQRANASSNFTTGTSSNAHTASPHRRRGSGQEQVPTHTLPVPTGGAAGAAQQRPDQSASGSPGAATVQEPCVHRAQERLAAKSSNPSTPSARASLADLKVCCMSLIIASGLRPVSNDPTQWRHPFASSRSSSRPPPGLVSSCGAREIVSSSARPNRPRAPTHTGARTVEPNGSAHSLPVTRARSPPAAPAAGHSQSLLWRVPVHG